MNKINPLYILALMLTLVLLSFQQLNEQKNSFYEKAKEFESLKAKAKEYRNLSNSWANKQNSINTINQIVNSSKFRKHKILKVETQKNLKVKIESKDSKVLNDFLNRVLNKQLIIEKMELQKDYIALEIGYK
ncbi:hypothetical protein [Arcobacter roscoffensis]|uniref:Uncharacterized protein n=1 Tax=Arcobacter roscoffensis TaxID=2961520 RepID=A0ABY5E0M9_9BACT|nr:hypothetical protein [Arcobacter roscoffensis]UTJ05764.1 hypothetical protein NJU99_10930 [Arcobacter roscoffensis]